MLTARVLDKIRRDFSPSESPTIINLLGSIHSRIQAGRWLLDMERLDAAMLAYARGDGRRFREAATLAGVDWRDALIAGGLANDNWREQLQMVLES